MEGREVDRHSGSSHSGGIRYKKSMVCMGTTDSNARSIKQNWGE